ncbi:hypothetical protein [Actinomadura sp. DC4]|uniref:hypothetical protein n=1 Tax=Actinomadura sp. DC4 TaxID=3055069 RepID=UPI0025B139EA|nr:hypothetical protein [Actinomadura sp. DC4]MDN3357796.1 hypothetical protein [Actinomadura sp. DC4]
MHATTELTKEDQARAVARLHDLETVLIAHGFTVEVEAKFWQILVCAAAEKLVPVRSQRVQLGPDPAGALNWYFVFPVAADELPQLELICSEDAIPEAVEIIADAMGRVTR